MPKGRPRQKSEYGRQLAEKQELRETYALRERQFRNYFHIGSGPESIYRLLEMRIDNVVYRCGFASTIRAARQLVSHGHIFINGQRIDVPSYMLKMNDIISIRKDSLTKAPFRDLTLRLKKYEPPFWIVLDHESLTAKINGLPIVDDPMIANRIKPVIEFYSR